MNTITNIRLLVAWKSRQNEKTSFYAFYTHTDILRLLRNHLTCVIYLTQDDNCSPNQRQTFQWHTYMIHNIHLSTFEHVLFVCQSRYKLRSYDRRYWLSVFHWDDSLFATMIPLLWCNIYFLHKINNRCRCYLTMQNPNKTTVSAEIFGTTELKITLIKQLWNQIQTAL